MCPLPVLGWDSDSLETVLRSRVWGDNLRGSGIFTVRIPVSVSHPRQINFNAGKVRPGSCCKVSAGSQGPPLPGACDKKSTV